MANNNHKSWSEQYGRYIYKDENGDWMVDAFGPTDELSILRELDKVLENLRYEQSALSPKGPVPTDEGSRFIAHQKGDLDAIHFVLLEEEIDYVKEFIQQISDGKTGGRPGMDQTIFLKDLQTVLEDFESVALKNPHKKITYTRIAKELIDKHGYDRTEKHLAEVVSKVLNK